MTRESQVVALLVADSTLMALLTGGIYSEETVGIQGLRRGADSPTNAAFDAEGLLLPTAVVREGAVMAYANVRDIQEQVTGVVQPIEIYLYQHRDKSTILSAKQRIYELLEGTRLTGTYPLIWIGETPVFYDVGPVANSTTIRQDWRCVWLRKPAT